MDLVEVVPEVGLSEGERVELLVEAYVLAGARNPRGLALRNAGSALALLRGNAEPVLELLRGGMDARGVAGFLGVPRHHLYTWLLEHAPVEWGKLSAGMAVDRLDQSEELLDRAVDKVDVSRASVMQRGAQWNLERLAPRLFGAKGGSGGPVVVVNVDRSCGGQVEVGGGSVFEGVDGYGTPDGGGRAITGG